MTQTRPYELIVFDWDGTLMDSAGRIVASMQGAARDAGLDEVAAEAVRNVIGLGLPEALAAIFPAAEPDELARMREHYRTHFLEICTVPTFLFDGATETLEALRAAGLQLAVATGKSRHGLDRVLEETNTSHFFCATRCADETRSKPHPQMLLELIEQAGVAAEQTLMIGDTHYDLQMAANAGVDAVAVSYGVHGREVLLNHQPLACLDCIRQLAPWLQSAPLTRSA